MMGKKKLSEIKAEVVALLAKVPGHNPRQWLEREIRAARVASNRDVETLEMLRAALEGEVRKGPKPKTRRRSASR